MMTGLEAKLRECEETTKEQILAGRDRFEVITRDVFEYTEGPFYDHISQGEDTTETIPGGGVLINLAPIVSRAVTPQEVHLRWRGDFTSYESANTIFPPIGVVQHVEQAENKGFIDSLSQGAEEFEVSKESYDTREAQDAISNIRNFADMMLVNPRQLINLREIDGFLPYWRLPDGYVNRMGRRYLGRFGAMEVYQNTGLPSEEGLIYDRGECCIRISQPVVSFNDYNRPNRFSVQTLVHGWVVDQGSAVKIRITD